MPDTAERVAERLVKVASTEISNVADLIEIDEEGNIHEVELCDAVNALLDAGLRECVEKLEAGATWRTDSSCTVHHLIQLGAYATLCKEALTALLGEKEKQT